MPDAVARPDAAPTTRPATGQQTGQDGQQPPQEGQDAPEGQNGAQDGQDGQGEPETFTREYVQQLRDEAAGHRVRARDRDTLADRLVLALTAADGRLADPDDLPRADLLADPTPEAVHAAVDALLERKPHLASRRPIGDAGQGVRTDEPGVSLLGLLRGGAG